MGAMALRPIKRSKVSPPHRCVHRPRPREGRRVQIAAGCDAGASRYAPNGAFFSAYTSALRDLPLLKRP
jgi:hypothetical protein